MREALFATTRAPTMRVQMRNSFGGNVEIAHLHSLALDRPLAPTARTGEDK